MWVLVFGAFILYGLVSLLAYRPVLPGESSHIPTCACGDPALQTWFLRWVPYAITHGHNPLFSNWTNYPYGVDLAQNTEMPLLGLLTAPLTVLVSPIASYTLLLWLAFPASATAMFYVVKRWTGSSIAALVGGFLYGFSAYVVGQGVGHVMLSFVPLPPLFFYQLHKLVTRRDGHPYRQGLVLGAIGLAQFFIESELLATLAVIGLLGILILAIANLNSLTRADAVYVVKGLAGASSLTLLFATYPLWFLAFGPQHFTGPVNRIINRYHSTLLSPLISTRSQHFSPHFLLKYGERLGNVENGSYLGLPVILLIVFILWRFRRDRWIQFSVIMATSVFILSLGPRLAVVTGATSIPLPFALLGHVPVLNNMIPSRLSLYVVFFAALTVSLGISRLGEVLSSWVVSADAVHARRRPGKGSLLTISVLSVLAAVSLVPNWPYSDKPSDVPKFFTSDALRQIPAGSVVLTYPFPYYPQNQGMMWEAVSAMRFKEVGTYALVRAATGHPSTIPRALEPAAVQQFLVNEQALTPAKRGSVEPQVTDQLVASLQDFLVNYHISTVIEDESDPTLRGTASVMDLFIRALGQPEEVGGVAVWRDVPSALQTTG